MADCCRRCPIQPICVKAFPVRSAKITSACGTNKKATKRRTNRWFQAKPRVDRRIYRNGEHMCISYAGHVPGEMYIHGRNLPTSTTFAKRRLCTFTPYEFVDPDGCCSKLR